MAVFFYGRLVFKLRVARSLSRAAGCEGQSCGARRVYIPRTQRVVIDGHTAISRTWCYLAKLTGCPHSGLTFRDAALPGGDDFRLSTSRAFTVNWSRAD